MRYPSTPGFTADSSTSIEAAEKVAPDVNVLRRSALWTLHNHGPLTADEIANSMGFFGLNVLKIRPRITELRKLGLVERTDDSRPSALGNNQHVMRLTDRGHDALKDRINSLETHVPNVVAPATESAGQLALVLP